MCVCVCCESRLCEYLSINWPACKIKFYLPLYSCNEKQSIYTPTIYLCISLLYSFAPLTVTVLIDLDRKVISVFVHKLASLQNESLSAFVFLQ